jgi:adenosylcobinamide-GDP ribazoletransferase
MKHFYMAWFLLSSLPLPFAPKELASSLGRAAGWFPLVGLVFGLTLAGIGWVLYAFLPVGIAAALILVIWVALTGMLHLDGFMDSCDGLLPPRKPARRLEIMKDSRVGAFGVVGGVLLLLLKYNALLALPAAQRLPALIVTPTLARGAMTWAMARYPLARSGGMGKLFTEGLGHAQILLATAIMLTVLLGMMAWPMGLALLAATWLITALLARLAMSRIHGLTGDVYGAICEAVETVTLVIVAANII